MINPIRYALAQENQILGEPNFDLIEVCYAHECVWLSQQCGANEMEARTSTRYEFDFPTPELAYQTARRMVELLEKEFPGIGNNLTAIKERVYPVPVDWSPGNI